MKLTTAEVMENGFLRYRVTLVKADGSSKVLEREATPHRCCIIEKRVNKLNKTGYGGKLLFKVSKVI